jgi:hypothetical protein
MSSDPTTGAPDPFERALAGATLLGAEIDTRYRVLAATFEPPAGADPRGEVDDPRVQLLCHPVSTVLGALQREVDGRPVIETFEAEQLSDVAAALAGAPLEPPVLGRPEPRPGEWGPQFSLQGRSTAPDGRSRTVTLDVSSGDARLRVFVRCDEIELRDPAGDRLPVG